MTDAEALTAAILSAPDDDLPRLVFADYLDETGDPAQAVRAEFIRIQCELARPDDHPPDQLHRLLLREKALLDTLARRWLEPLKKGNPPLLSQKSHGQFRRGFVEVVWMPADWFVTVAERLFARCPVRELRVTETTTDEFRGLLACDHTFRLEVLDLSERKLGNTAPAVFAARASRWPERKLRALKLRACEIDDTGAATLAGIPASAFDPTELDVSLNPLTNRGLRRLRQRYGTAVRFDPPA